MGEKEARRDRSESEGRADEAGDTALEAAPDGGDEQAGDRLPVMRCTGSSVGMRR